MPLIVYATHKSSKVRQWFTNHFKKSPVLLLMVSCGAALSSETWLNVPCIAVDISGLTLQQGVIIRLPKTAAKKVGSTAGGRPRRLPFHTLLYCLPMAGELAGKIKSY